MALQLRKTSSDATTSSTLGVLALNALGRGGIGDSWQTAGLNSTAVRVECTADAPVACFADGGCETVWLQSGDCSGHNATLVTLIGKTLAPAVAQLHLSFAARSLRERLYSFFLHVPVWNGSGWQFASIDARLQIHAVADAQQSEVRVGRENEVDLPGSVVEVSHLDQLVVEIGARDVDGAPIHRMGERIAVQIVSLECKPNLTELAQFDADRVPPVYVARISIAQPGEYLVRLDTDTDTAGSSKASVRVVCAKGYSELERMCSQEVSKTQLYVGCAIGGMFVVVGAAGIHLLYTHRAHARLFVLSFLKMEVLLAFKAATETWDIAGDRACAASCLPSCDVLAVLRPMSSCAALIDGRDVCSCIVPRHHAQWQPRPFRRVYGVPAARTAPVGHVNRHEHSADA